MNRFELAKPTSLAQAREMLEERPGSVFKAGGIDLLDRLKEHLLEPPRVVDLKSVPGLDAITALGDGSLRIGALATLARVAAHDGVCRAHPALARACAEAASPQIRNVATIGGNLLQAPRCWYYRLESYPCWRKGAEGCFGAGGESRYHAIFGGGPCYAPHPSNAAVALVALGASFVLEGVKGARTVPAEELFAPSAEDLRAGHLLAEGEVLCEIRVPPAHGLRSTYAQIRERATFDWPLVSVAAALRISGGVVADARIVLGAVAPVPWRVARSEQALVGRRLEESALAAAAEAAVSGADPLEGNAYKVALARTLLQRTLPSLA